MEPAKPSLNPSQARHLLVHCEHADQLLSEIENILTAAASKSPFPRYTVDVTPAQAKIVQDYIARVRAQLIRVLAGLDISPDGPKFGAIHSIRVTLAFIRIAIQEISPRYLAGYGEVPAALLPELNGLTTELEGLIDKLDGFLAQPVGEDLRSRLEKLDQTNDEVGWLRKLDEITNRHGLVEFRPTLSTLVDRLANSRFEIALFGQVSSGKSSLLNHVLGADVLPVGVNPVTAVPTRLVYGATPRLTVSFVGRKQQRFEIESLAEFAAEQQNPANAKGVTRIVLEYPSARMREGIVFVDTPGLGSLATSGAAETLAYLPQCDLGVILINAGAALTQEDLSIIQALYAAGAPAYVLLSKADLLRPQDRQPALEYIQGKIGSNLGLELPVHPVSIMGSDEELLHRWFEEQIAPLYTRQRELVQQSLRRKVGALRDAVEAALRSKIDRASRAHEGGAANLQAIETALRRSAGAFPGARQKLFESTREMRNLAEVAISRSAARLVENSSGNSAEIVNSTMIAVASEKAGEIYTNLTSLARDLGEALQHAASSLGVNESPDTEELLAALREMPQMDLRAPELDLKPPAALMLSKRLSSWRIESKLTRAIGDAANDGFTSYARHIESWGEQALNELQHRFDLHGDAYRAQIERLAAGKVASPEEQASIRKDLEVITREETLAL
jgi:GTP-binding protein EngB required for normal cell division